MKKKISSSCLHIADYYPPFRGSFVDNLVHLGKQLEKKGCRLILMVPCPSKWNKLLIDNNMDVIYAPIASFTQPLKLLKYLLRLKCIVKEENVKIIHCHFNLKYLSFAKVFVGGNVKIIWHWHNMPKTKVGESRNVLKALFRDLCYKMASILVDRHIAISSELYAWLSSVSKKASFIPNSVSLERFDLQSFEKDNTILDSIGIPNVRSIVCSVANFRLQKDHYSLLKAAKLVIAQRPGTYFVLVGDGPTKSEVEENARKMGIIKQVIFTGIVTDPERIMQASDVVVLSSFHEGFPLVVLEAMALEKPVVATDVGGCRDAITPETGFLTGMQDYADMADKILWLLDNPEKAKEMGKEGRKVVETKFSMKIWSERIMDLYSEEDPTIFGLSQAGIRSGRI